MVDAASPGRAVFSAQAPALMLCAAVAAAAPVLGAGCRPLFIFGCLSVGWYAWRAGPAQHLQAMLILFAFAPFVRRVVDVHVGFDDAGLMLVGPLLALTVCLPELRALLLPGRLAGRVFGPLIVVALCVVYAAALSGLNGQWMQAASGTIKWLAPIIYAAGLLLRRDELGDMLGAAASAFTVTLPIAGLYGIYQYVDPPVWDRYWLQLAAIASAGYPEPFAVRTFSTLNSPASFATYAVIGLIVVFMRRAGWVTGLVALPASLALMLSLYRTAWLALAVGLLFCALFAVTRFRAVVPMIAIAVAVVAADALTPFGDVVGDRLSTFADLSSDGSGRERMEQYVLIWTENYSGLVGRGFSMGDVAVAGSVAVDGLIVQCWTIMGLVVGLICVCAAIATILSAVAASVARRTVSSITLGAIAAGWLIQLPLGSILTGELGFLFWTFCTLAHCDLPEGETA